MISTTGFISGEVTAYPSGESEFISNKTKPHIHMHKHKDYIRKIWTDSSHHAAFAGTDKLYKIIRKEGKFNIGRGSVPRLRVTDYLIFQP
jgi:hypothetical protein